MPHIHTEPNQHDMTVSGYIIRTDTPEPTCLVHMHRKMGKLMQIGGHIELNQTPWQAIAAELEEESGYRLEELRVAQHSVERVVDTASITHPAPFLLNTHSVGNDHFHSDLCYGFVANAPAQHSAGEGESMDLRWMTIPELREAVSRGEALEDMTNMYEFFIRHLDTYALIPAADYSLAKPTEAIATYRYGAPGQ